MERRIRTRTFVLCLCGSILIWLLNKLNQGDYSQTISYPVDIRYNDSLFVPLQALPKQIDVTIEGEGWQLLRKNIAFASEPLVYTISNPESTTVLDLKHLEVLLREQSPHLKIKDVTTDSLLIRFDRMARKQVIVVVDSTHIDLKPNIVVSSLINVEPRLVVFEGPASEIAKLPGKIVLPIAEKKIGDNYDDKLPLPQYPLLKSSVSKVSVSFEVGELLQQILSDSTIQLRR